MKLTNALLAALLTVAGWMGVEFFSVAREVSALAARLQGVSERVEALLDRSPFRPFRGGCDCQPCDCCPACPSPTPAPSTPPMSGSFPPTPAGKSRTIAELFYVQTSKSK